MVVSGLDEFQLGFCFFEFLFQNIKLIVVDSVNFLGKLLYLHFIISIGF